MVNGKPEAQKTDQATDLQKLTWSLKGFKRICRKSITSSRPSRPRSPKNPSLQKAFETATRNGVRKLAKELTNNELRGVKRKLAVDLETLLGTLTAKYPRRSVVSTTASDGSDDV